MWAGAGAAAWAAGGAALLLLLALRCRRRKRPDPHHSHFHTQLHQVHIVRDSFPTRKVRVARATLTPHVPRRATARLACSPPNKPQPSPTPQIVVIQNTNLNTIPHNAPQDDHTSHTGPSASLLPATSAEFKGIPKLPLPEQWLHKRPYDYKYSTTIPRPLAQIVSSDLGSELNQESRAKKFSATRSPSLEKDDKSPFLNSAKSDKGDVFGFDAEAVSKIVNKQDQINQDMSAGQGFLSPKETGDKGQDNSLSPSNLRRFRSVSTRLHICSEAPQEGQHEKSEMQNSPRILECSSAKEKSSASKFDFSPRILANSLCSPRFFTPPETVSPAFFAEPSPKSVYYDTVRSPKFFPETPHDSEVPQSPRALSDSNTPTEKCNSPRILSARPSPKLYSCNKENYFTFEPPVASMEALPKMSSRPRRYAGRNSIERERFTPPADKEVKKYRRHNSCDTNYKIIELNMSKLKCDEDKEIQIEMEEVTDKDVVDCCADVGTIVAGCRDELDIAHELKPNAVSIQTRRDRQRLKSISLDSDNAKIIEQNLGLPIAKQMKDQMNEAYKNQEVSTSCESIERHLRTPPNDRPIFKFEDAQKDKRFEEDEPKTPDLKLKKTLRQSSDMQSFIDMPRFSPKEFEIIVTNEEGTAMGAESQTKRKGKNLRNLTIDLTKRDSDLEKELLEFEKLYTDAEEKKVKTPTLKIKSTSLDSSESVNLSLPQQKTLDVPQNSVSVPNTPKRQLKRIIAQKASKYDFSGGKIGYNSLQSAAEQRRLHIKGQDSGIFLRENHASLMLYQPGTSRMGSRTMGSFDEQTGEFTETPVINISGIDHAGYHLDAGQMLGSNLLNYKQNLSISSTNLKTLPEGVLSDDFEPSAEDEKSVKKLHRRNSNQSLMLSTHSLQGSNCSLNSSGASLAAVRTSISNFSLNDSRQKLLSYDRRDSNASVPNAERFAPTSRGACSTGEVSKNCLLQRRGSNNSLTLNLQSSNLTRHSSNTSLNKEIKPPQKKGLLERRSSNTSLTLNINSSNPQLSLVNRGLSVSNYNLNGSTCNLSRYNSNQSMENAPSEPRKGILERRSSNTSLTLNIQPQEPRDLEIDENMLERNLKDLPHRETHRKSLSTENLIPKSYKNRNNLRNSDNKPVGFGSHDNLWSNSYATEDYPQNLTYVCGDQENEIIYAFGRKEDENYQQCFVRNITTKPLSPQSTSEDFRLYLANMQHLQNASSVLSRQQLRDLNDVFQNGYSKVKCHSSKEGQHCCSGRVSDSDISQENPQMAIPEPVISQPCSEYQKKLLRSLHQEFWDMPTNFQEKPIVSGSHPKNRYKTILPNEHSRFILRGEVDTLEGYINANLIKGHEYTKNSYIATQGPLQNTIYDFWLMVHQNTTNYHHSTGPGSSKSTSQAIQKIVMLTNFIENNRQKCEQYFPLQLNEEITFKSPEYNNISFFSDSESFKNAFVIRNSGMIKKSGYTIRRLTVQYQTNVKISEVTVYHYWFHNWADHKCPKDVNALLNLSLDVLQDNVYDFSEIISDNSEELSEIVKSDSRFVFPPAEQGTDCENTVNISYDPSLFTESHSPPTIVHCSAGIGRTGCLIAIMNGVKQLMNELKVDVLGIVCNMRLNRGGMVQNSEQYELIHKVLCLFEQACLPQL